MCALSAWFRHTYRGGGGFKGIDESSVRSSPDFALTLV